MSHTVAPHMRLDPHQRVSLELPRVRLNLLARLCREEAERASTRAIKRRHRGDPKGGQREQRLEALLGVLGRELQDIALDAQYGCPFNPTHDRHEDAAPKLPGACRICGAEKQRKLGTF